MIQVNDVAAVIYTKSSVLLPDVSAKQRSYTRWYTTLAAGRSLQQQVVNPMEKRVKVLKLTPHDNVGTALQDLKKGDTFQIILDGKVIGEDTAKTEIPFGFKAALGNIPAGTNIVKYAHVIGRASIDIQSGELVHIHNIEGTRGRGDLNQ